jgi:hypothetical protein
MFRPHMGLHQATLLTWGDHCTVHFVFCTCRHIVVVNLFYRMFLSYFLSSHFSVPFWCRSLVYILVLLALIHYGPICVSHVQYMV